MGEQGGASRKKEERRRGKRKEEREESVRKGKAVFIKGGRRKTEGFY